MFKALDTYRTSIQRLGRSCLRPAFCLALCAGAVAPQAAHAQAVAAGGATAGISVFGGGIYMQPDYGTHKGVGYVFGADYTRFFPRRLEGSLELRAFGSSTPDVSRTNVVIGPRFGVSFAERFHPWATFMLGYAGVTFKPFPGITDSDSTIDFAYGGGLDVDVTRLFSVRGDVIIESQNYGHNQTFLPYSFGGSVVYHIPFKDRRRR